jgi:3-phosphoshikimate 1-carboxyvinyltransferase
MNIIKKIVKYAVMDYLVKPCKKFDGFISPAGDKSISHRLAILGAIAHGDTIIRNHCTGEDFFSTLKCLSDLGINYEIENNSVIIHGKGLFGLKEPKNVLYAGNSGTTIRLLTGVLAAQQFASTITGDESLINRPMKRIIEPLSMMGAQIEARRNNFPPLSIRGTELKPINYILPIGSAQVKSAILLAALYPKGKSRIRDPFYSRNHTENLLPHFNADISFEDDWIIINGQTPLKGIDFTVPGDFSSAAFFIAGAILNENSSITIKNVGLNPTRTGFLNILKQMQAKINILNTAMIGNEKIGDISIASSELRAISIDKNIIPSIIDELPIFAVLATKASGITTVRGAEELRYKETDRIKAIVNNLTNLGISIKELKDGFIIKGQQKIQGGTAHSYSDHRIAMAMAIAGTASLNGVYIKDAECVSISYPNFFETLYSIAKY